MTERQTNYNPSTTSTPFTPSADPVATIASTGDHEFTAYQYTLPEVPTIWEHPMQWKQLQKILEPYLGDASKSVSRFLEENASSLEDFLAIQGDKYYPRSGGTILGSATVGNVLRVLGATYLEQQLWRKYGNNEEPVGHTHVGMVVPFAGTATRPNGGWLVCDGTAYNQTDYPYLFDVIGTTYNNHCGAASPSAGQFRVPNYKGRVLVGQDPSDSTFDSLTDYGGAKDVTLTAAQSGLPAHSHIAEPIGNFYGFVGGSNFVVDTIGATGAVNTGTNTAQNASQSHTNLQPYAVVNYIIKY